MFNSVQAHRRQPTRLPCPWDSPGKNTGVGCHFLLQSMKVKSESVSDRAPWGHSGLHGVTQGSMSSPFHATFVACPAHRSQSVHFKALTLVCSRLSQYKAESFASRKPLIANPTKTFSQCQSSEQDYSYLLPISKINFSWSI